MKRVFVPDKSRWNRIDTRSAGKKRREKREKLKIELLKQSPHCTYCNTDLTYETSVLSLIKKIFEGGIAHPSNLVLSCFSCNREIGRVHSMYKHLLDEDLF